MNVANFIKSADWKAEKHVPVITLLGEFTPSRPLDIEVSIGKEIPHPNTVEHHIAWMALYYLPDGGPFPIELARANFPSHGTVSTAPVARFNVTLATPGTLHAIAYCNLHGLWESDTPIGISQ